jgi:hypothetical protein
MAGGGQCSYIGTQSLWLIVIVPTLVPNVDGQGHFSYIGTQPAWSGVIIPTEVLSLHGWGVIVPVVLNCTCTHVLYFYDLFHILLSSD